MTQTKDQVRNVISLFNFFIQYNKIKIQHVYFYTDIIHALLE